MEAIRRLHHEIDQLRDENRELARNNAILERERETLQTRIRTVEGQKEANAGSRMLGDAGVQHNSQTIAAFQHELQVQEMQENHQAAYKKLVQQQSAEQRQAE